MVTVVVIYDGACGACSAIAVRLDDVLAPAVLTRSCRDPGLAREFPVLRGHLGDRPCRRPHMIVKTPGNCEVVSGLRMMARAFALARPGRRVAAMRLGIWVIWRRLGG